MKLLMFHVKDFWYKTYEKNLAAVEEQVTEGGLDRPGIVAWVHVESPDLEDADAVSRKAAKNLKWLARKVETETVVLHSFAHLSNDRAEPQAALRLLSNIAERLRGVGFTVTETPWGHFNEFRMHVEGPSLAKVWKEI